MPDMSSRRVTPPAASPAFALAGGGAAKHLRQAPHPSFRSIVCGYRAFCASRLKSVPIGQTQLHQARPEPTAARTSTPPARTSPGAKPIRALPTIE